MREGGVRDPGPHRRVDERRLEEDLAGSPLRGRPLRRRLRNFRPDVANYVVSLGGPRHYMARLREIEVETERHLELLGAARDELARDPATFEQKWVELANAWSFVEVNDLIDRHNRFFPAEARLPMEPRTGDFVLVAGERFERRPLDAAWILGRFPAALDRAA